MAHRDSLVPGPPIGSPTRTDISTLLGKFDGAELSVRVSESESQQGRAPERSGTAGTPAMANVVGSGALGATPTLGIGQRPAAVDVVQMPPTSRGGNLGTHPATGTGHFMPESGGATTEAAWQRGDEANLSNANLTPASPTSTNPALPSSASVFAAQQFDANSQRATAATTLPRDAAPEGSGIQASSALSAGVGGGAGHPTDTSTSGQGKSGQQNSQTSGDNPANVITIASFAQSHATNAATDSAGSLVLPHTPNPPGGSANISTPPPPPSSSRAPGTLSAWQNYDGGAGSIVRSASLTGSANSAEMHVEFRTGALGPLEVHAVVNGASVGAEIHVQGQEAHTLLVAGVPALERALGERNLRVENIAVYQDHAGGGATGGEKQNQQSDSHPSAQHQVLPWGNPPPSATASGSLDGEELTNPAAGLSIRA